MKTALNLSAPPLPPPHDAAALAPVEREHLWDEAYDDLRQGNPDLVTQYEKILSRDIEAVTELSIQEASQTELTTTSISQTDPEVRWSQMSRLLNWWLDNHDNRQSNQSQDLLRDHIRKSTGATPPSALAWVCVYYASQIFLHPQLNTEAVYTELINIISKMNWYNCLPRLIISGGMADPPEGERTLRKRVVDLYKEILSYLMNAAILADFPRGLDSARLKTAEEDLSTFGGSLIMQQLHAPLALLWETENRQDSLAKEKRTRFSGEVDEKPACLSEVDAVTTPTEMKHTNESLTHEVCQWVCSTEQYKAVVEWGTEDVDPGESSKDSKHSTTSRVLFLIGGGSGINKTALMEAIVQRLSVETEKVDSKETSWALYYSCGRTGPQIGNSTKVLRSLICSLLQQQPMLQRRLDRALTSTERLFLFDGPSDFTALSGVFFSMLRDRAFVRSYLVIDGIDACSSGDVEDGDDDLSDLLRFIKATGDFPHKIRWLVSTDINAHIKTELSKAENAQHVNLEDAYKVGQLSRIFHQKINSMVDELATLRIYSEETKTEVSRMLIERSKDSPIWAVNACTILRNEGGLYAVGALQEMLKRPDKLFEYARAYLERLCRRDLELCKSVLSTITIAYRPLQVSELARLADLPSQVDTVAIIEKCRSFLEVQSGIVKFVDPAAQQYTWNYLQEEVSEAHSLVTRRSLEFLSQYFKARALNIPSVNGEAGLSNSYGTIHWLMHLLNVKDIEEDDETINSVTSFMKNHLLVWLDAITSEDLYTNIAILMKKLNNVLIKQSREESLKQTKKQSRALSLVRDALRVIHCHASGKSAATNPNCFAFYPEESVLRQNWLTKNKPWVAVLPNIAQSWSHDSIATAAHSRQIRGIAFSPNGRLLASGSDDKTVRIWDAETGAAQLALKKHRDSVLCVTFSSAGLLASGSENNIVHIWDLSTGRCLTTLNHWSDGLWDLRFSPDGKQLLAGTKGALLLWDVSNLDNPTVKELGGYSRAVNFSPRQTWIASSGQTLIGPSHYDSEGIIDIWDARNVDKPPKTLRYDGGKTATSIVFSSDEKRLVSDSGDYIKIWSVDTGRFLKRIYCGHDVLGIAFSPYDYLIVVTPYKIMVLDSETEEREYEIGGHTKEATTIAFSPQGCLASGSKDMNIRIWGPDCSIVNDMKQLKITDYVSVNSMVMSPDGNLLASIIGGSVYLWDGLTGQPAELHSLSQDKAASIWFSPDGKRLASTSTLDNFVRVWNVNYCYPRYTFKGHSDKVNFGVFSPDGRYIASASNDSTVRIWNCPAEGVGEEAIILQGHTSRSVWTVAFSPDGKLLASRGRYSDMIIWDRTSSQIKHNLKGERRSSIKSICFSQDSSRIVSHTDAGVRVWDSHTGACIQGPIKTGRVLRYVGFDLRMPEYFMTEFGVDQSTLGSSAFFSLESLKGKRYGISAAGDWITWNGRGVIPIPEMYRPTASWVQGNIVAIGTKSGKVLLFRFSPDVEPPS